MSVLGSALEAVPVNVANRFFGLLTLLAAVTVLAAALALLSGRAPQWAKQAALPAAASIALGATLGSLYYSEIAGYPPCTLCWYQRIAIYPQVIILGAAALRQRWDGASAAAVWMTSAPLALAGVALSAWHVLIEIRPGLGGPCEASNPCTIRWVAEFGILTIPTMALIAGLALLLLPLVAADTRARSQPFALRRAGTNADRLR